MKVKAPMIMPIKAPRDINFNVSRSNSLRNLYTATKSAKIRIGKVMAKASVKGITTVINGIDINATDPPNPAFDIPNNNIAGTTVIKKRKFISIIES